MKVGKSNHATQSLHFWGMTAFLALVSFTGGGTRIDIQSSVILFPAATLMCGVALMSIRREHFLGQGWFAILFSLTALLVLIHLLPLPHSLWSQLPGRRLVSEIDDVAGLGDIWRPLTLTPANGWHTLSSLLPPMAVFLLGIQLRPENLYRLLDVMIGLGVLSAVFGLLQVISGKDGPLYLYQISSNGYAVGLFANRNHAATQFACIFPMLAVFATNLDHCDNPSRSQFRLIIAAVIGASLIPVVLLTGSRTGAVVALLGLGSAVLLYKYRRPQTRGDKQNKSPRVNLGAGLIIVASLAMVVLSVIFARAASIDRFLTQSNFDDVRMEYWRVAIDMLWKYFPVGSGAGSFVEAFQIDEPAILLANTYLNRAHNDWLETAVTFGIPGVAILLLAVFGYLNRAKTAWSSTQKLSRPTLYARMASIAIGLIGLASVTDYPLRTPAMMCFLVVFVLWLNSPSASHLSADTVDNAAGRKSASGHSNALSGSRPTGRKWPQVNKLRLSVIIVCTLVFGWLTLALAVSGITRNKAPTTALKLVPFEASALANRADELFFANPAQPSEASFRLATTALKGQAINAKAMRLLGYRADLRGEQLKAARLIEIGERLTRRDAGTQLWLLEASARSGDVVKTLGHYDTVLTTNPETSALLFPRLLSALDDPEVRRLLLPRLQKPKDWTTNFLDFSIASASDLTPFVLLVEQMGGVPASLAQQKQQLLLLERLVAVKRFDDARKMLGTMIKPLKSQLTDPSFQEHDLTGKLGVMGWQLQSDSSGGASLLMAEDGKTIELNVFVNSATTKIVAERLLYLNPGRYTFRTRLLRLDHGHRGFLRWQLRCPAISVAPVWTIDSINASLQASFSIPDNCPVQFLDMIASGGLGQTGLEATVASVAITPGN